MKKIALILIMAFASIMYSQERELKITVKNAKGKPVRAVKVETFPSNQKGSTGKEGICVLNGVTDKDSLIVVLPGAAKSLVFACAGISELQFDTSVKDPVGYDPLKKIWITANTRKIIKKGDLDIEAEIRNGAVNLEDILKRMPSLMVTSGTVSLRNAVSTNENPDISPLIVVDNFVVRGGLPEANRIVNINLIESVTVEKDGTLWGREGLNGVIIVKLKK